MSDIDNLLKEGIAALKAGQRVRARALLQEVVREQSDNVAAWLWLSGAVETDDKRRECLERVLEVDPDNPHAKKGLERLGPRTAPVREPSAPMAVVTEKPHATIPVEKPRPPSKIQTCLHCGVTVQGQHKFCMVCGGELTAPTIATAYPPRGELLDREKALPGAAPRRKKRKEGTKGKPSGWQVAVIVTIPILLVGCALTLVLLLTPGTSTPAKIPSPPTKTPVSDIEKYEASVFAILADMAEAISELNALLEKDISTDHALSRIPYWQNQLTSASMKVSVCSEDMSKLSSPAPEYDEYHRVLTSALGKYAEAATLGAEAMCDDNDMRKLDKLGIVVELMGEAERLYGQAKALHEELPKVSE